MKALALRLRSSGPNSLHGSSWLAIVALSVMTELSIAALPPGAAPITYVDATDGLSGNTGLSSGGVFGSLMGSPLGNDNWWSLRPFANGGAVFTTNDGTPSGPEDGPGLVTTISGLGPGRPYYVLAYFWSDQNNWQLKGSLTQTPPLSDDPAVSFSKNGGLTSTAGSVAIASEFANAVIVSEGNRMMYQAELGQTWSDSNGQIRVWIDDLANATQSSRTWYDGVGYSLAPEPTGGAMLSLAGVAIFWQRRNARRGS